MASRDLSRRDFLLRFSALGALTAGSGTLLAACGGGDTAPAPEATPEPAPEAAPEPAAVTCNDLSGLSETDRAQSEQMRQALSYVDVSPEDAKHCENCALYVAAQGDAACGGCNLIKGPIAPKGYCTSWAPKQA